MARSENQRDWFGLTLQVINPALVMGLVGSLAFFLIDALYRGQFEGRLRWTMIFFVFGAVMASRVALVLGSERGWLYGLILGGVTYAAALRFAGGLGWLWNAAVIAVIAAAAYVLTRDTTWRPDEPTAGGRGLAVDINAAWDLLPAADGKPQRRRHGLWVVAFSLAALPVFGLGESLIPAGDAERLTSANRLMSVYVACGLGLLLTTALVSFRARLKSRRLRMPHGLAALWLGLGLAVITLAMVAGAVMPRPGPAPNWLAERVARSSNPSATAVAPDAGAAGTGKGRTGSKNEAAEPQADATDARRGNVDANAKSPSERGKQGEKGREFSKKSADDRGSKEGDGASDESPPSQLLQQLAELAQRFARWLVIAVMAIVALLFALRRVAAWNRAARRWYNRVIDWLGRLFGRDAGAANGEPMPSRPAPARYGNPFHGSAGGRDTAELVTFSFAALAAWAERNGTPRRRDETPDEFAVRVESAEPDLAGPVARLVNHYSAVAYAAGRRVPESARADVEAFWCAFEPLNGRAARATVNTPGR